MLCQFLLYNNVNWPQVYIHSLFFFFKFPSNLGHHGALSRVPCAMQQFLISIFLIHSVNHVYMSLCLPIHPTSLLCLVFICQFSTSVSLFLLCKYLLLFPGSLSQCRALESGVPEERGRLKSLGRQEMNVLECICVLCMGTIGFSCPALGITTWAISL